MDPASIGRLASLVLTTFVTCFGLPAAAQGQLWKGYTFFSSANHPDFKSLETMAADFVAASGGTIQTRVNVGGSLPITATGVTQAVAEGVITFAHDGFFTGNVPIGGLPALPLLLPTHAEFQKAIEILTPYLERDLERKGVKLLATYNFPLQTIWSTKKLTGLDDLSGKKLRVTNALQAEFLKRFGVTPVTIGSPDVASALQRGVVEGVTTASAGGGRLWGDMLSYNLRLGLNYDLMLKIANKETFDKLPVALQAKMLDIAKRSAAALTKELADSEDEVTQQLKAKGVTVTVPGRDVYDAGIARIKEYWPQWAQATGPEAVEALAKIRTAVGR